MVRPGRHDEKAARESAAAGLADRVDRLPGNDHRHDGGLAGAGGELQGQTHQLRVRAVVGIGEVFQKPLAGLPQLRGDLGQPNGGFHGFDLTKERPNIAELVMTPVLEETLGIGRDLPIVGVREAAPLVHVMAELVDDGRSRVVLLLLGREPLAFVENQFRLTRLFLALPRLGNGRDELGLAPALDNPLRRLAVFIELPIPSSGSHTES